MDQGSIGGVLFLIVFGGLFPAEGIHEVGVIGRKIQENKRGQPYQGDPFVLRNECTNEVPFILMVIERTRNSLAVHAGVE